MVPIVAQVEEIVNGANRKTYKESQKFRAGMLVLAGKSANELTDEIDMSRSYIYEQKAKVQDYINALDEEKPKGKMLEVTKEFIKQSVISLMLNCRASIEGAQRHIEDIYGVRVSAGRISGIMKEASEEAKAFDEGIDLSGIRQGANDEIFQGNTPIMVGIDAESTYAYLLEEAADRTGETWQWYMEYCKDQGLNLEVAIVDGGSGLNAGIPKAFEGIEIQADTFHAISAVGKEVSKAERAAESAIKTEAELEKRMKGPRPQQKTKDKLEALKPKAVELIQVYDNLSILFTWLRELLSFSGYNLSETYDLIKFVLDEMDNISVKFPGIARETKKVRNNLPQLLSFTTRLEKAFDNCALESGIPPNAFHMMYRQLTHSNESIGYLEIEYALWDMLKDEYNQARSMFWQELKSTKKASSMVENLNGRIRSYIEVKRVIPAGFFVLMKVYFNTRRYKRSRCPERIGKSPIELMTGKPHPDFFEVIGF